MPLLPLKQTHPPFVYGPAPLPLRRRVGENFWRARSPKLRRTVTFLGKLRRDFWLGFLESRPEVSKFCERPTFADAGEPNPPFDFWIRTFRAGVRTEIVASLDPDLSGLTYAKSQCAHLAWCAQVGLEHRRFCKKDVQSRCVWVENWRQILPFLTLDPVRPEIASAVVNASAVAGGIALADLEKRIAKSTGACLSIVRAHIFGLLQRGLLAAPSLETTPLSRRTVFVPPDPFGSAAHFAL